MMPWIVLCICLVLSSGLLVMTLLQTHSRREQVLRRLRSDRVSEETPLFGSALLLQLGRSRIGQRLLSLDSETQQLLSRIGWRRANRRALFTALQLGTPLVFLALVLLWQLLFGSPLRHAWLLPVLSIGAGLLLPKRLLAFAAARRQRQLAAEISTFIPLLRILFDSGLTVEQALRVLSIEGRTIMPNLSLELSNVLSRVDSGLELAEQLQQLDRHLAVDEVRDCLVILQQLIRQGGGAMSSLLALKQLLDQRRLTGMQEHISKLSAKMAVVMMVFLFPALLIVLAGPGLSAISRALGGN